MRTSLLLLLSVVLTVACSSPLDKEYHEATLEEDAKELKESGALTEDDADILAAWLMRAQLRGDTIEGKTYAELIAEAKDYKKEQKGLAEKAKAEAEQKRQKLGQALTVALFDKGYVERDYRDLLTYDFAFENKSEKEIRAFKGLVTINDLFDEEITTISLTVDDPIPAGEQVIQSFTSDYNQFLSEDTKLRSKDLDDLKVVWTPEKIIFSDGTTLE